MSWRHTEGGADGPSDKATMTWLYWEGAGVTDTPVSNELTQFKTGSSSRSRFRKFILFPSPTNDRLVGSRPAKDCLVECSLLLRSVSSALPISSINTYLLKVRYLHLMHGINDWLTWGDVVFLLYLVTVCADSLKSIRVRSSHPPTSVP